MTVPARRMFAFLLVAIVASAFGVAEAGVNSFWKGLGGSESGGGISKLPTSATADQPSVAFGSDNLPVAAYSAHLDGNTALPGQITVRRWTGTAWENLSGPTGLALGFHPRIAISSTGVRFVTWLQDDGNGLQVHLLRRAPTATAWTAIGGSNASGGITMLNASVLSYALAVGADGNPVVAFEAPAQTGVFPLDEGILQGSSQIYVVKSTGTGWQYLGGDPTTGGASNARSFFVDGGASYAVHTALRPALTVVNNRPTIAFEYTTELLGNSSAPVEFIPGNSEIFVLQFNANGSTWVALGTDGVPQIDDGGAARGGLGGMTGLSMASTLGSITSRDGATAPDTIWITWTEGNDVYARQFTGSGWEGRSGPGSDLVFSDPFFANADSRIALGPNGAPIVVWSAFDGGDQQIFARRDGGLGFTEMGPDSADGPGISDAAFAAVAPAIASAPTSGGPAVAWLNSTSGDDRLQVYLRQFSTAQAVRLNVTLTGATNGSAVWSTPIGIDCPDDTCSAVFPLNQVVTLTALGGADTLFDKFTGCTTVVNASTCTVLMNAAKNVSANFVAAATLDVITFGNGLGSVRTATAGIDCTGPAPGAGDCTAKLRTNASVTLNAVVPTGTVFGGWDLDCAFRGMNTSCTLPMNGDHQVRATFVQRLYNLFLSPGAKITGQHAAGTMNGITPDIDCVLGLDDSRTGVCSAQVSHGTRVEVQSVAAAGHRFIDYITSPAGLCSNQANSSCAFTMTANSTLTAGFRAVTALSVNRSGTGALPGVNVVMYPGNGQPGSSIACGATAGLDCLGEAYTNSSVTFTTTVAAGSDLDPNGGPCAWAGTGAVRTCAFTAGDPSYVVNARYTQQKRRLHLTGNIRGLLAPGTDVFAISDPPGFNCGNQRSQCDLDVDHGTRVTVTPFGDANTDFKFWTGCTSVVNQSICLVDMIANKTIVKNFDAVRTLRFDGTGNGSGTVGYSTGGLLNYLGTNSSLSRRVYTGAASNAQTSAVVTPKAAVGSSFTWVSSDFGCTGASPCTAPMGNNHSAVGRFTLNRHSLLVQRNSNASIVSTNPLVDPIDCGPLGSDCSSVLDYNTEVILVADPIDGYDIVRWNGVTCAGSNPANSSCKFTMRGNLSISLSVRANTTINLLKNSLGSLTGQGTLTAKVAAGGTLVPAAPTCGPTCSSTSFEAFDGRLVTISAAAGVGSQFDGYGGGVCGGLGNSTTCTFLPSGDTQSVNASFSLRFFFANVVQNANVSVVTTNPLVDPLDCGALGTDCQAGQFFGRDVHVVADPIDGFTFVNWITTPANLCNNQVSSTNSSCGFKMPAADVSLRAVVRRATRVNVNRIGSGLVASNPAGVNCGVAPTATDCSETFLGDRSVTFTATPATGFFFAGFGSPCPGTNASTCAFTPTGDVVSLNASFVRRSFAVSVLPNANVSVVSANPLGAIDCGPGVGQTDCGESILFDQPVTITAAPIDGFGFVSWVTTPANLCNGVASSTNDSCSFRMPAGDVTLRAVVRRATRVTVLKIGDGLGTVTSNPLGISCGPTTPDCSETFFDNRNVVFTAVPATGSSFGGFGPPCPATNASTCSFVPTNDSHTLTAAFDKQAVLMNLNVNGDGIVSSGPFACDSSTDPCQFPALFGDSIVLRTDPGPGNRRVSVTGCTTSNTSHCTVLMTGNKNVIVTFSYFVAVTIGGDAPGTVTRSVAGTACGTPGCTNYTPGQALILTGVPTGAANRFGSWDDDCAFRGANTSCPLSVTKNTFVTANFFKPVALLVNRLGSGNGSVTSTPTGVNCGFTPAATDCSELYPFNAVVTLTAVAAPGSAFGGFLGCDSFPTNSSCRITLLGNRTVDVTFLLPTGTVVGPTASNATIPGGGGVCGTGGSDCRGSAPNGLVTSLAARPAAATSSRAGATPAAAVSMWRAPASPISARRR